MHSAIAPSSTEYTLCHTRNLLSQALGGASPPSTGARKHGSRGRVSGAPGCASYPPLSSFTGRPWRTSRPPSVLTRLSREPTRRAGEVRREEAPYNSVLAASGRPPCPSNELAGGPPLLLAEVDADPTADARTEVHSSRSPRRSGRWPRRSPSSKTTIERQQCDIRAHAIEKRSCPALAVWRDRSQRIIRLASLRQDEPTPIRACPSPARAADSWSCRRRARRSECPRFSPAHPPCRPRIPAPPSCFATSPNRCPNHPELEPARATRLSADSRENDLQQFVPRAPIQPGGPSLAPASKSFGPPPTCGCGSPASPARPERRPRSRRKCRHDDSCRPAGDDCQRQRRLCRAAARHNDVGYPPGCRTKHAPALKEAEHVQSPGNQPKNEERAPHHAGTDPEPRLTDSRRPLSTLLRPFSDAAKGGLVPPNAKLVTDVPERSGGMSRRRPTGPCAATAGGE